MADNLPDELIKEILEPLLTVADEVFGNTWSKSPFVSVSQSYRTSGLLLVCKRWLRVATPSLYNVVVLRSKAQAQALDKALKSNKMLGLFIKKLRMEGGFGASINNIVNLSPNITHLLLSLSIAPGDSVSGLCRALPLMNPIHLILVDHSPHFHNAAVRKLAEIIPACIEKHWKNLETVYIPYMSTREERKAEPIARALSKAPKLRVIYTERLRTMTEYFRIMSTNPSLENLEVVKNHKNNGMNLFGFRSNFLEAVDRDPRLQKLVNVESYEFQRRFCMATSDESEPEDVIEPHSPFRSSYIPMASASDEVRDHIWSTVIRLAMEVDDSRDAVPLSCFNFRIHQVLQTRGSLLLVSKSFHRIALPHFYTNPILSKRSAIEQLAARLTTNPDLGLHMRSVFINQTVIGGLPDIQTVFACCPGLVHLRSTSTYDGTGGVAVLWAAFVELANVAGRHLLTFQGPRIVPVSSGMQVELLAFQNLSSLRTLSWNSGIAFDSTKTPSKGLPALERLDISNGHTSFFVALSKMELPNLHYLKIPHIGLDQTSVFLAAHGSKIRELDTRVQDTLSVLKNFPSLEILTVSGSHIALGIRIPTPTMFECETPHQSLRKLTLQEIFSLRRGGRQKYTDFFEGVDWASFPALREIHICHLSWPTTEYEITRDSWVKWAEMLLQWNIKITDHSGNPWVPRLKPSKR